MKHTVRVIIDSPSYNIVSLIKSRRTNGTERAM